MASASVAYGALALHSSIPEVIGFATASNMVRIIIRIHQSAQRERATR